MKKLNLNIYKNYSLLLVFYIKNKKDLIILYVYFLYIYEKVIQRKLIHF
jgi:hypothetical protein